MHEQDRYIESLQKNVDRMEECLRPARETQAVYQQMFSPFDRSITSLTRGVVPITNAALNIWPKDEVFSHSMTAAAGSALKINSSIQDVLPKGFIPDMGIQRFVKPFGDLGLIPGLEYQHHIQTMSRIQKIFSGIPSLYKGFDFIPWESCLLPLPVDEYFSNEFEMLSEEVLKTLYECKWFPYAGWNAKYSLFEAVKEIMVSSRGVSRRREKRIDALIIDFYTKKRVRTLKQNWRRLNLMPHFKKILGHAVEAHLRGEYVLSISCLSTMWEELIHQKLRISGRYSQKKMGKDLNRLIEENRMKSIFGELYNNYIICDCNTSEEVLEGIPNRNAVSHGKYHKYPNKKASLNALLITDFVMRLKPRREMDED